MKDLINRYIWLVDTLTRYDRLTRKEINELWRRSAYGDGNDMPERTFFYYRRAIEENFHIDILCDKLGRYYIDPGQRQQNKSVTNWLLESYAANSAMKQSAIPTERVSVEDVPSAREHLPTVLGAIGDCSKLRFTYAGFSRTRPEENIVFHPYFVKRYKQRWYMIGLKEKSKDVRTYALDRVKEMTTIGEYFVMANPGQIFPGASVPRHAGGEGGRQILGLHLSPAPQLRARARTAELRQRAQGARPARARRDDHQRTARHALAL